MPTPRETRHAASIRAMVETIEDGGSLSSSMEERDLMRLHLAVVRYVNKLGPGDVPDEYHAVKEAMADA